MGNQKWATYADFYRKSDYNIFPQEHRRSKGLYRFNMICVDQGPHHFEDPQVPETIVALPVSVDRHCTWRWSMAGRQHEETAKPNRIVVVPSRGKPLEDRRQPPHHHPDHSGYDCTGGIWILFECENSRCDDYAVRRQYRRSFRRGFDVRIWNCTAGNHAADHYMADGILMTLMAALMKKSDRFIEEEQPIALPKWRFSRVADYADANMDRSISIEDLADAAGISRTHFLRSFRAQTGETPHRWLMARRLERAKQLLQTSDADLSDIAAQCGFSSQSHLCTVMKNALGMSPKRWRDSYRS